jgi:hypothetical protein
MIYAVTLLALAPCHHGGLSLAQAKALVMATPSVRAAVVQRHAKPFFEAVIPRPNGWTFDLNSRTKCANPDLPCSTLLGHFSVSVAGNVKDLDAAGGAGAPVSSEELQRLKKRYLRNRC